jgi:hypothetical protein
MTKYGSIAKFDIATPYEQRLQFNAFDRELQIKRLQDICCQSRLPTYANNPHIFSSLQHKQ